MGGPAPRRYPRILRPVGAGTRANGWTSSVGCATTSATAWPRRCGDEARGSTLAGHPCPRPFSRKVWLRPSSLRRSARSPGEAGQDARRATDARADGDRGGLAVLRAGPAFHARAAVGEEGPLLLEPEDGVRTDRDAQPASVAGRRVEGQRDDALEVSHRAGPPETKRPVSQRARPTAPAATCAGTARRVSRRTPDREV